MDFAETRQMNYAARRHGRLSICGSGGIKLFTIEPAADACEIDMSAVNIDETAEKQDEVGGDEMARGVAKLPLQKERDFANQVVLVPGQLAQRGSASRL